MNILFVLYVWGESNSSIHASCLAQALHRFGHHCMIAGPGEGEAEITLTRGGRGAPMRTFEQVERQLRDGTLFPDGRGADVYHAWTPREAVRQYLEQIMPISPGMLVVHMEDHEDELVKHFLGRPAYLRAKTGLWTQRFPDTLMHPVLGHQFIAGADGVSMLVEAMQSLLPAGKAHTVVWPAADDRIYFPRPPNIHLRNLLGISDETVLLVYTGNGHPANYTEIRSLYLAVHLLNRRGIPTRLVRTGVDFFAMEPGYREWADEYSIELNRIPRRTCLGDLLSTADVLVQPGVPGPFNDVRFPSKLPEFFASGRPVVLPRSNIGLETRHLRDAYVVDRADGPSIAAAVETIAGNPELKHTLALGSRAFYEEHFSWDKSAGIVDRFYLKFLKNHTPGG